MPRNDKQKETSAYYVLNACQLKMNEFQQNGRFEY